MIYCTLNNWHCVLVYILTYHRKVMEIMASLTQYRSIKNYFKNSSVVLWEHCTSNNAKTARICAPSLVLVSKGLHTWGGKWILEILSNYFFPISILCLDHFLKKYQNSRFHWLPVVSLFPLLEPSLVLVSDLTKDRKIQNGGSSPREVCVVRNAS